MSAKPHIGWGWPLFMAFIRLPLILIGSGIVILAYRLTGISVGIAAGVAWATLTITVVNAACLGLLFWRAKLEGVHLSDMIGFQRRQFLRDLGLGILWSMLLYALMLGGIFVALFTIQSITGPVTFGQIFVGNANTSFQLPQWLAVISAVVFPILNAPVEELQYRGYTQPRLIALSGSVWCGILITAAGFGLQHMAFALTLSAAPIFVVGFFLWGFGAGIIAHRQQRLAPLIIAHFMSNLLFGVIPLFFVLQSG